MRKDGTNIWKASLQRVKSIKIPITGSRVLCEKGWLQDSADVKKIYDETRDPRTEPVNASTKDGTVDWRETEEVPEPPMAPWKIGAIYQKLSLCNFIHGSLDSFICCHCVLNLSGIAAWVFQILDLFIFFLRFSNLHLRQRQRHEAFMHCLLALWPLAFA